MLTINIKNSRKMFLKKGKVWVNGVEYSFQSHAQPNGTQIVFKDFPAGTYKIWIGVGQGKGGFRSKKLTVTYNGAPTALKCSYATLTSGCLVWAVGIFALFIPNSFYKLKYD